MSKSRVLIIAEAANPEWVSVPLVGWSLASALRDVADVHIVTQIRNRDAFVRAGLVEGRDFTAIDSEAFARPLWKLGDMIRGGEGKGWTTMQLINAVSYPHFERLVWRAFKTDIRAGKYDIVHRVTPLSPTIASSLARKCARVGVPFVVGPINGGVPWPDGFDSERRREREWLSYVRSAYKALPGRRRMLRSASAILVGSHHTGSEIPSWAQEKCVYIPENGIDPARFSGCAAPAIDGPLRAVFLGRLVPYKGPDMLLEAAMPLLKDGRMGLDIVGDGPMMADLRAQAGTSAVTFHGWQDHQNVSNILKRAHLLTFPSIREFGGGVVLEAMSLGIVPVIVDYAGPGELVTTEVGYKIPLGSRAQIVQALRAQLETICAQPEELPTKSSAAQSRVQSHFTWAAKAAQISRVYDAILTDAEKLPEFFVETKEKPPSHGQGVPVLTRESVAADG